MEDQRVPTVTLKKLQVIFIDDNSFIPSVVTIGNRDFWDVKATSSEVKKLAGWGTREKGLASAPFMKELRDGRNAAVERAMRTAQGLDNDPFVNDTRRKRARPPDNMELPSVVTVPFSDHPNGSMNALVSTNPKTTVSVELTVENLNYVQDRLRADVADDEFHKRERRCLNDTPCPKVREFPQIRWQPERRVYYFYASDNLNQKRYKSVHVARSDDADEQTELHEKSADEVIRQWHEVAQCASGGG